MAETFANNATGNLNASILIGATSLVLQAGQGAAFPATGNFRITFQDTGEIALVGARSGDTLSSITRGVEGTSAAAHNSGVQIIHEITAGALGALSQLAAGVLLGVRVLTGSGTYTPTAGTTKVYIECVGGGGGGGGCAAPAAGNNAAGSGGGGGAYSASFLTSGFSGTAYAVGGGGNGGAAGNNNGTAGTDTTFGTTVIVAKGGGAGVGGAAAAAATMLSGGGAGGSAGSGTGDVKVSGYSGTMSWILAIGFQQSGTGGAGAMLGATGPSQQVVTAAGNTGTSFGGGGNGGLALASAAAQAGGNGAAGTIRIWEFA